jgi:ribosomal protein L11 methyltransferase
LSATRPIFRASIEIPAALAEAVAARLEAAEHPEAGAVTLFDRGGNRAQVSAYYAGEPSRPRLMELLRDAGAAEPETLSIEQIPDRNWVAEAESLRPPVRAGRFLIHGAHDRDRISRRRHAIEIDASLAFGTAHHASTKTCLLALDRLLKEGSPNLVLDIGTGSGILAIAAAKASEALVLAGDNDQVAVAIATENARKNGVAARVHVVRAEGLVHPLLRHRRADLLLANLLLRPLLQLAPDFARALRPGGVCVLSGILSSQAAQVVARYRSLGFALKGRIPLDEWRTLIMTRRSDKVAHD